MTETERLRAELAEARRQLSDAAAAQVNTWLSDTRDWLDHQAKARRGD